METSDLRPQSPWQVSDLVISPALWPWPGCTFVSFDLPGLGVAALVHSTRELYVQLSHAVSDALGDLIEQESLDGGLDLVERGGRQFATMHFDGEAVQAMVIDGDCALALFTAIIPSMFAHLLSLPLECIRRLTLP